MSHSFNINEQAASACAKFFRATGRIVSLIPLLGCLLPSLGRGEEPTRQREIWIPEKSLPQILAANPKAIVMTREEYKTLVKDAAKPVPQVQQTPPINALIRSAKYTGRLAGNTIVAEAEFEIDCLASDPDEWQSLNLPIDLASLGTVSLDNETAIKVFQEAKPVAQKGGNGKINAQSLVLIRTAGKHKLNATFYIPVNESVNGSSITIPSPQASAAQFALELPARYTLRTELPTTSKKAENGNLIHTIPLPNQSGPLELSWRARDIAPLAGGAVLQTCSYLYQIDPVRVTSDLGIVLRSALARVPKDIKIGLPETAKVLSVEGPDVLTWTMEKNTIFLSFTTAELRETNLRILLETPPVAGAAPSKDLTAFLPQPFVDGVHRASGSFAILASSDVRVRSIATAGLTAQTTFGLPGDAAKKPGFVAGFAFPMMSDAPNVVFQQLEPRFQADQLLHIQLRRDTIELQRTLRILVKEGEIFTTTLHLPAGEETTSLALPDGKEPNWKITSPGNLEIKWPAALTPTNPGVLKLITRTDPEGWFTLGEKPRNVTIANVTMDGPELTTGYVALDFDERFHVATTTTGLEPTDPMRLAANGVSLHGRMTWALADSFTLGLAVSRRPSEVHVQVTSYALPLLHTCEVEGQIELDVRNSGVRSLLIAAPPAVAGTLRFDSPLISERKLQPLTGEWTLTFHEELTGHPHLRYHWSLPLVKNDAQAQGNGSQQRFSISLPGLKFPEAGRVTGNWVIEANTDTELAITPQGLDARDTLALPVVDNYVPRHRVIASFGWRGSAWQLALEGTRHAAAPLPGLVIDMLNIQSVLTPDGTQRHQLVFQLRSNGEQFFQCPLPLEAKILSLTIDGQPLKPVADPVLRAQNQNGLRVQLPATIEARPATILLAYELPVAPWDTSGKLELTPPALNPKIPVLTSKWLLHLPEGYTYSDFSGNLEKEYEAPTKSLALAFGNKFGEMLPAGAEKYLANESQIVDFLPGGGGGGKLVPGHIGRVKLQVQSDSKDAVFGNGITNSYLETEFNQIKAPATLTEVVRSKNLTSRWNLDENSAVVKLSRMLSTNQEKGTDLFTIEVFSPDANEAAELANAVADAYETRRRNYEAGRSENAVTMLHQELESQEKKVEEKRVEMLVKMKSYNIIDFSGVHSMFNSMTGSVDDGKDVTYKQMASRMAEFEAETAKLKSQLKALSEIQNQDQLIEQASTMNLEGPTLKEFLPKYHTAKLELDAAKAGGLNDKHPKVVALKGQVEGLKKMLNEAVRALQKSLETKIEIAEAGFASLKQMAQNGGFEARVKEGDADYLMKKREYEQQFALLNEMREHILKQKVDLEMPRSPVQRHEAAYPNPEVVKRQVYSDESQAETYTGKTVRIAPSMPQPMFAGTPLPLPAASPPAPPSKPMVIAGATLEDGKKAALRQVDELWNPSVPKTAVIPKSGLIPLEITLPESGQTYVFSGNHLPSPITLNFTTWRRELQIGWLFILLGGVAAWVLAKRHPIFIGILIALILHFTPELLGSALQKACNGLLFGWTVTCVLIWITRKFHHRFSGSPQPAQP